MDRSGVAVPRASKKVNARRTGHHLRPTCQLNEPSAASSGQKLNFLLHDRIGLREGEKVSESTTTPVT